MAGTFNRSRRWLATLAVAAVVLAGCGGGSDDESPATTATSARNAPTSSAAAATPTAPQATPTESPVPATATPEPTATPSPTPSPTPIPVEPLGEIAPLDPGALTNYTLAATVALRGMPGQPDYQMELTIEQAAPDNYHLVSNAGGTIVESWQVGATTYLRQADGSIVQLPAGADTALLSPALLVQTLPPVDPATLATPLRVDEVAGRQATHYRIDGEDFIAAAAWLPSATANGVEGQVNLWIDNEWGIILRQDSDLVWENPDGSEGAFQSTYEMTNVLSTAPIAAPQ